MSGVGSEGDCLVEAFEQGVARARECVSRAYASPGDWSARVRRALAALLQLFDEEPALACLLLLDSPDRHPRTADRRAELLAEIVAALEASARPPAGRPNGAAGGGNGATGFENGAATAGGGASIAGAKSAFDTAGVVGAAVSIVERRLRSAPGAPLRDLVNPLMAMLVLPHDGRTASAGELAASIGMSIDGLRRAA